MLKIDVALASYNGEAFIAEQIRSILHCNRQAGDVTFELGNINVSDNLSSDQTAAVVKALSSEHPNVRYFPNSQRGVIHNFNHAIQQCSTDYVMLSDQDDVWLPEKMTSSLQKLLELEQKYGKDCPLLVFTDLHVTDSQLKVTAPSFFAAQRLIPDSYRYPKHIFLANVAPGCTMIMNRKLLDLAMPVPVEASMHDWWFLLVASTFGQVAHIEQPTMLYRQHENNQVGAPSKRYAAFLFSPLHQFRLAGQRLGQAEMQANAFLKCFPVIPERCAEAVQFLASFRRLSRLERLRGLMCHKIEHRTRAKKVILYLLALTLPRTRS